MLGVRGQFHFSVDAKGRLGLPSKLKEKLKSLGEKGLILTNYKGSLWGYLEDDWVRYEQALMETSPFEEESLLFTRAFIAGASECELDRQGRILIPQYLRKYAGMDREAVIISVVDRIEIWSKERWEQAFVSALETIDQAGGLSKIKLGRANGAGE